MRFPGRRQRAGLLSAYETQAGLGDALPPRFAPGVQATLRRLEAERCLRRGVEDLSVY